MDSTFLGGVCPGGIYLDTQSVLAGLAAAGSTVVPLGAARQAVGGAAAPLGTLARFSTSLGLRASLDGISPRVRRFMLQSGARELLPGERVAHCLRTPIGGYVDVLYSPKFKVGHLGGLQTCGSVWSCNVCQAKISERRAAELGEGVRVWQERGGQVVLATFTLQHALTDILADLLDDLMKASYALRTGGWWTRFQERHGLAGSVRSLENTDGGAGWHPHLHCLFFLREGADIHQFTDELRERWLSVVAKGGRYASPRWGLDVRSANEEVAAYLAKFGREQYWTVARELAKSSSKNAYGAGRSMAELLEAYVIDRDERSGRRWREYALTFKGRKQHVWSRYLRALLGLVVDEKTDEELAGEQLEDAIVLARLDLASWRIVLANDARGELCDVASSGDSDAVHSFLAVLGISWGDNFDNRLIL